MTNLLSASRRTNGRRDDLEGHPSFVARERDDVGSSCSGARGGLESETL
jgi:hypothetical protein